MSGAKQITNKDLLYSTGNYTHIFCENYKGKEYEKDYIYVCMHACSVMSDSATQWTMACQAPLSSGFFRQEYWNGLPLHSPGESSRSRDRTRVSCSCCTSRWVLYHPDTKRAPRWWDQVFPPNQEDESSLLFSTIVGTVRLTICILPTQ